MGRCGCFWPRATFWGVSKLCCMKCKRCSKGKAPGKERCLLSVWLQLGCAARVGWLCGHICEHPAHKQTGIRWLPPFCDLLQEIQAWLLGGGVFIALEQSCPCASGGGGAVVWCCIQLRWYGGIGYILGVAEGLNSVAVWDICRCRNALLLSRH